MARRSLADHFADLPDPRVERTRKHRLDDILVIALCAILCGATTFEDIEEFAECRRDWLETFLALPNGIPSHDTIYRVFCALDAKVFAACFGRWMNDLSQTLGLRHIAIDGKSLRGATGNTFTGCVHLVSAWATEHGLILGQESVAEASHEIAAIPVLLRTLHLKGALVTIDAAGCQTEIVKTIRDGGGDYLLAVKGNQPSLQAAVEQVFVDACSEDFVGIRCSRQATVEDGHGRHEERYVTVIENPPGLPEGWRDVAAVVQVNREREVSGRNVSTTHYYLTSLRGTAAVLGQLIRRHWAIENELHWVLDVAFGEDANRTRDRNASANLGVVRRTAIALLKQEDSKISKPRKMFRAALDQQFLERLLQGNTVI
jgi:predicted transposase YbfD/YdcC